MKDMLSNPQYIATIIAVFTSFVSLFVFLLFYVRDKVQKSKSNRYNSEKKEAQLDYFRKDLESRIQDLSLRLENTQAKWLDINHLILSTQEKEKEEKNSDVSNNKFLKSFSISERDLVIDNRLVFVLTPFHEEYRSAFKAIKNACNSIGLNCIRGDEEFIPNDIFPSIVKQIVKARIIIANITSRNPNVMYELGIAHALGKQVIIVSHNLTDTPFDLSAKRIILYNSLYDLEHRTEQAVKEVLFNNSI